MIVWKSGWYATRLHAVNTEKLITRIEPHSRVQSLCGAYVYPESPPTDWAKARVAAGIPKCKKCERKINLLDPKSD